MVSFEPVDTDYDKIGDEDYKWDDDVLKHFMDWLQSVN